MMLFRDGERLFSAPGLIYTNGPVEPLKTPLSSRSLKLPVRRHRRFLATCLCLHPRNLLWNAMEDQWNCNGRSGTHWWPCCLWPQSITCRCNCGCRGGTINTTPMMCFSRRLSICRWLCEPQKRSITNQKGRPWWLKKKKGWKKLCCSFGGVKFQGAARGALSNLRNCWTCFISYSLSATFWMNISYEMRWRQRIMNTDLITYYVYIYSETFCDRIIWISTKTTIYSLFYIFPKWRKIHITDVFLHWFVLPFPD